MSKKKRSGSVTDSQSRSETERVTASVCLDSLEFIVHTNDALPTGYWRTEAKLGTAFGIVSAITCVQVK